MGLFKFLFGDSNRDRARRAAYRPGVIAKNLISPINDYGTCFTCEGSGRRTLDCRVCHGSGQFSGRCRACQGTGKFERPAQACFACHGAGQIQGVTCTRCKGTGAYEPAVSKPCDKCQGSGDYSTPCRKCTGAGRFTMECKKMWRNGLAQVSEVIDVRVTKYS